MGLFDFLHLSIVLGKDIKKVFQLLGIKLSPDYKITEDDFNKILMVFGNMEIIYKYKLGPKSCREFLYILSIIDKLDFIGLDPKSFSYKLYKLHGEKFHGLYVDSDYEEDMKKLTNLYGY